MTGIADLFAELDGYVEYYTALAVIAARPASDGQRELWKRAKDAQRQRFVAGPNTRHGVAAYRIGCRCSICRQANTDYMREYQRRRAKDPAFKAKRRAYDKARRARAA